MVELTTAFATLSLFLAWRVHKLSKRLDLAQDFMRGLVEGKVEIKRGEHGFELSFKEKHNG